MTMVGPAPRARRSAGARRFVLAALALALVCGCATHTPSTQGGFDMAGFADVPDSTWAALAHKRVFFGHQSVGFNIMDGIAELAKEHPALALRIVQGDSAADGGPVFAHEAIGRNGDPGGKSDQFATLIEGGLGRHVDIAMHKYCFADFSPSADPEARFAHYQQTMSRLKAEYPNVTFVHVTAPLVTIKSAGPKLFVQRLLGRPPVRVAANIVRERYNDLLRKAYAGREPLFDLATIESTWPDGSREGIAFGGHPGYSLVPAYASDGSHLNEAGRRRVAEAFLMFLAALPPSGAAPAPQH